jgi:hypothetical protein
MAAHTTTHNTQHTTHNTQHTTHNTQHTTHNTQHTTHNTQHTTHNTQHTTRLHARQQRLARGAPLSVRMKGGWRLLIFVFSSSNVVRLLVLNKTSVWSACVSKILTDILFYVRDIPQSTRTIREPNLIKWCQWEHLLDRILKGLRVRGAGLKLFMVSINDLVCQLCIGCSLSHSNNGTKLCVIADIFGLSYSFRLVSTHQGSDDTVTVRP